MDVQVEEEEMDASPPPPPPPQRRSLVPDYSDSEDEEEDKEEEDEVDGGGIEPQDAQQEVAHDDDFILEFTMDEDIDTVTLPSDSQYACMIQDNASRLTPVPSVVDSTPPPPSSLTNSLQMLWGDDSFELPGEDILQQMEGNFAVVSFSPSFFHSIKKAVSKIKKAVSKIKNIL